MEPHANHAANLKRGNDLAVSGLQAFEEIFFKRAGIKRFNDIPKLPAGHSSQENERLQADAHILKKALQDVLGYEPHEIGSEHKPPFFALSLEKAPKTRDDLVRGKDTFLGIVTQELAGYASLAASYNNACWRPTLTAEEAGRLYDTALQALDKGLGK